MKCPPELTKIIQTRSIIQPIPKLLCGHRVAFHMETESTFLNVPFNNRWTPWSHWSNHIQEFNNFKQHLCVPSEHVYFVVSFHVSTWNWVVWDHPKTGTHWAQRRSPRIACACPPVAVLSKQVWIPRVSPLESNVGLYHAFDICPKNIGSRQISNIYIYTIDIH